MDFSNSQRENLNDYLLSVVNEQKREIVDFKYFKNCSIQIIDVKS